MAFVCVSNPLCRVSYFQMVSATIHAYVGFIIIILQSVSVVIRITSLKTAKFNVSSLSQRVYTEWEWDYSFSGLQFICLASDNILCLGLCEVAWIKFLVSSV